VDVHPIHNDADDDAALVERRKHAIT